MDTQRLVLFIVFVMSVFFLMDAWHQEKQPPQATTVSQSAPGNQPAAIDAPPPPPVSGLAPQTAGLPTAPSAALQKGDTVRVETNVFVADIDTAGGDLRRLELLAHRDTLDKTKNFTLLQQQPDHTYIAQSGLLGSELPNHRTLYSTADRNVKMATGADTVSIRLAAPDVNGVKVTKVYTFHRGSYLIDVGYEIQNAGNAVLQPSAYFQLVRDGLSPVGDAKMLPTYTGMAVYTDKSKFEKVTFKDVDNGKVAYPKTATDGWIAFLQHYFLSAWLPHDSSQREFYTQHLGNGFYSAGVIVPVGTINPGAQGNVSVALYAGPQEQDQLSRLAPGLDLTVDYGWLTIIAKPLFLVLQWIHQWAGNWGLSVVVLTVALKGLFYPLSAMSYRSMAKMREIGPRMQKLKEQHSNDRQRLNQAMMELYKTENINPLGGCLPMVAQIPVFIALYWVLLASVELRQAPFIYWIHDLSAPDPYYVLPVLMAATMIFQTFLNPAPPDPVQAKVMKIMPIAFSVMFFFFPAGLVLYWLINNMLSILQQWYITRTIVGAKPKAHGK